MTSKKTYALSLCDGVAVILECKTCHASASYPLKDWRRIPFRCANCSEPEMNEHSKTWQILDSFRLCLKRFIEESDSLPFDVKLEFEPTAQNDAS